MDEAGRRKLKRAYTADARQHGFPLEYVDAMVAETERLEALSTLRRVDREAWKRASYSMAERPEPTEWR
jgi:hypothetical protein